jgi:hypothetical protein
MPAPKYLLPLILKKKDRIHNNMGKPTLCDWMSAYLAEIHEELLHPEHLLLQIEEQALREQLCEHLQGYRRSKGRASSRQGSLARSRKQIARICSRSRKSLSSSSLEVSFFMRQFSYRWSVSQT